MSAWDWLLARLPSCRFEPLGPLVKAAPSPPKTPKPLRRTTWMKRGGPLPRTNPERRKRMHDERFAEQAQRCRESPCCACGARPAEPHHWPTVANGGVDRDTCPLCAECHSLFHDFAGSPEAFMRETGCDLLREIARMRGESVPAVNHHCEDFPVLKQNRFTLTYHHVCNRCGNVIDPDGLCP